MIRGKKLLVRGLLSAAAVFTLAPLVAFVISAGAGGPSPGGFAGAGGGAGTGGAGGAGSAEPYSAFGAALAALFSASTLAALRFSLSQAFLSTLLALIVGFPGAFFVAKYRFRGRRFFLSLAAVPFCLPPILVILSFILYYGKNGWFTRALGALGLGWRGGELLYSFWGLVFVHAFYNFPIIIQNVGSLWSQLPRSREEAARTLGAGKWRAFVSGSLPQLLPSILQSLSLIFLFCFFSFTIVLVFGGLAGSTLEVGIYRAIRFTNDKPRALALAFAQTSVALAAVAVFAYFDRKSAAIFAKGLGSAPPRKSPGRKAGAAILLYQAAIAVFFLGPLFALAAEAFSVRSSLGGASRFGFDNFTRLLGGGAPLLKATANSLALSGPAALAALLFGASIAATRHYAALDGGIRGTGRPKGPAGGAWITALPLALSSALISAGWSSIISGGAILIVIGQATIAWPFAARFLDAAFSAMDYGKNEAARTLGASSFQAMARVDLPLIAPSLAAAAAFAFSITMGDANIPLVLGSGQYETLPLLLYRLASSYRFNEACAVGLVLALFTSLAFFLKEKPHELS